MAISTSYTRCASSLFAIQMTFLLYPILRPLYSIPFSSLYILLGRRQVMHIMEANDPDNHDTASYASAEEGESDTEINPETESESDDSDEI